MSARVILAGCGNMGFAMLQGWVNAGRLQPSEVLVVEPNTELRARAAGLGAAVVADAADLQADAAPELVILAVKPQVILDVARGYSPLARATFLSIAAGTTIASLEQVLGAEAAIVRCMPNTPAAIGKGMLVTFAKTNVAPETARFIAELLSASGRVASVEDERLLDAVTAVSGSGPAYVFHFIECLTAAAEAAGLPPELARLSAMQTVFGAACLAAESGTDPAELRRQVTSPNGTTAAALDVLMGGERMKALVGEAVEAARRRSVELGR